jgi:hypothetical protein
MSALPRIAAKNDECTDDEKCQLQKSAMNAMAPDPPFHRIGTAIRSTSWPGIVYAPARIYCCARGHRHWGALIYTSRRIRAAGREGTPHRRADGVGRERFFRLSSRIRGGTGTIGLDGWPQSPDRTAVGRWRCG